MDLQAKWLWLSEKEKQSYMQELHDTVLQSQIVLGRSLRSLTEQAQQLSKCQIGNELALLIAQQDDIIHLLRHFCSHLQAPGWSQISLEHSLLQLIREVDFQTNIETSCDVRIEEELDPFMQMQIYRIVQELIRNAIKHSRASKIKIVLSSSNTHIYLHYGDDGVGINGIASILSSATYHFGLKGIYYRCAILGGTIDVKSKHNEGLHMMINIPFVHKSKK